MFIENVMRTVATLPQLDQTKSH